MRRLTGLGTITWWPARDYELYADVPALDAVRWAISDGQRAERYRSTAYQKWDGICMLDAPAKEHKNVKLTRLRFSYLHPRF